jgi:site-specific recombinase XerC
VVWCRRRGEASGSTGSARDRPWSLPLVGRYVDHLRAERGLAGNTVDAYRRDLSLYARYLEEVGIADPREVVADDLEAFVGWLRQRRSGAGQPYAARPWLASSSRSGGSTGSSRVRG